MSRRTEIRRLHARRPRSRLVRLTVLVLAGLAAWAFLSDVVNPTELFAERRARNLARFLREDALPAPLREGRGLAGLLSWSRELLLGRGLEGLLATTWISVSAIVLAGALGLLLAPLAARNLMRQDPAASEGRVGLGWRAAAGAVRSLCVLLRAVPEYVLAFLLLAVLGGSAWPAVLALGFHNAGILGRLGADTIENLERAPLRALAGLGARRTALVTTAAWPMGIGRYLLYFFYRYETCVREATVLGLLGIVSLGYFVQDARARQRHDEMLFLVALGAVLVALADVASLLARRWLRRAGG